MYGKMKADITLIGWINMKNDDIWVSKLIIDEIKKVVLIVSKDNEIVLANDYARQLILLSDTDGNKNLENAFGRADLYGHISSLAFNYHWQGALVVNTKAEGQKTLEVKAKYIPGQKCVFHDLLIIGSVMTAEEASKYCNKSWNVDQDQFRKLCEISSTINSNLDFQSICAEITMKAAELIGADRSLLYSVNDLEIGVLAAWNMTEFERNLFRLVDIEHGVIKNCLRNMAPVLVPYYSRHPDWIPEIYQHLVFESFILYPLLAQKQLVGVLALFGKEPMRFGDHDLMLLQMISNQMAIAVLNAQVYSEIRKANQHLEEEVCIKVHEHKISELQLIRKHAELEAVFHAITDILVLVDDSLRVLDINKAAQNYYGLQDKRHIIGKYYCDNLCEQQTCKQSMNKEKDCSHKLCASCMHNCSSCYLRESRVTGNQVMAEVDIGNRVFMISIYPIINEVNKVDQIVCCTRDITITKRKREELMQGQKMQAIGHLAAGLAHELRNPLGAISNCIYILEDWFKELEASDIRIDQEIKKTFTTVTHLVERSENVIRNLLDFSRNKPSEIKLFKVSDMLDQILLLLGNTAQHENIKILIKGNKELTIKSDSNAMQHIFFNLIINAIHALTDGGEIVVEYSLLPDGLAVSVTDNGIGIKPEDIDKVFNPFYTTKSPDRGTGLGLYVVYNLVEQLSGTITAVSDPGVKTTFTVYIPHDSRWQ
jgi:signal transduction histidine kinase